MSRMGSLTDFERGLLAGLLIGEGHFGVTGDHAQFTLGMHVRHAALLRYVQDLLPGSVLYGPYHHRGRYFMRLMLRGDAVRSTLDIFDSLQSSVGARMLRVATRGCATLR
jgi:hypothetical protein